MAKNRVRTLVLACVTLLCCLVLIAGATYALFSTQTSANNQHLQAGTLEIKLERISYEWAHLDANGFVSDVDRADKNEVVDFTDNDEDNIFGLTDSDWIAPGCYYTAHMRITNTGTVAFQYWFEITLDDESSEVFAGQLEVTVEVDGNSTTKLLTAEDLFYGDATNGVAVVSAFGSDHDTSDFTITVKFLNDTEHPEIDNNEAIGKEVSFDLTVHAIQVTEKPAEWED